MNRRRTRLSRVAVLCACVSFAFWPTSALAVYPWDTCKVCEETLGLFICIRAPDFPGPTGWIRCTAYTRCLDGKCYEFCDLDEICMWA